MMRFHRMRSKWEVLPKTPTDTAQYVSSRGCIIQKYKLKSFVVVVFYYFTTVIADGFHVFDYIIIRNFEHLVVLKWPDLGLKYVLPFSILAYTESASGQDEANRSFWLATPACKDFPRWSLKKKFSFWPYNKFFIDHLVRSRWLDFGIVRFCDFYWSRGT